jgi:hypothetical protein
VYLHRCCYVSLIMNCHSPSLLVQTLRLGLLGWGCQLGSMLSLGQLPGLSCQAGAAGGEASLLRLLSLGLLLGLRLLLG